MTPRMAHKSYSLMSPLRTQGPILPEAAVLLKRREKTHPYVQNIGAAASGSQARAVPALLGMTVSGGLMRKTWINPIRPLFIRFDLPGLDPGSIKTSILRIFGDDGPRISEAALDDPSFDVRGDGFE